jgi:hypothetical protein
VAGLLSHHKLLLLILQPSWSLSLLTTLDALILFVHPNVSRPIVGRDSMVRECPHILPSRLSCCSIALERAFRIAFDQTPAHLLLINSICSTPLGNACSASRCQRFPPSLVVNISRYGTPTQPNCMSVNCGAGVAL